MQSLWNKLWSSKGLRSAAIVTAGNVSATVISAVAMILFSRALGPEGFGQFSVLFSLMLILTKFGDLGLNIAVQREISQHKKDFRYIEKIVRVDTLHRLVLTTAIAVFGIFAGRFVGSAWLGLGDAAWLTPWIFVGAGTVIFYEYVNALLQGKEYFGASLLTNFVQSAGKLGYSLLYFVGSLTLGSVTFAYLLFPALGTLAGFVRLPISYLTPRWDRGTSQKLLSVAKWTGISIVAATIADNLDVIIVQNYLSSYETGLWSATTKIAMLSSLVAWSVGTVLNVRVASYHDKKNLHAYLKKALYVSILMLGGLSLLAFVSVPALTYSVGDEYVAASSPLSILFISTAILAATSPFVALFYLFDKPAYFAHSGIIGTVILIAGDILLIPAYGLMGAAYARIAMRGVVLVYTIWYARRAYVEKYG